MTTDDCWAVENHRFRPLGYEVNCADFQIKPECSISKQGYIFQRKYLNFLIYEDVSTTRPNSKRGNIKSDRRRKPVKRRRFQKRQKNAEG